MNALTTFDPDTHAPIGASVGEIAKTDAVRAVQRFLAAKSEAEAELARLARIAGPMSEERMSIRQMLTAVHRCTPDVMLYRLKTPLQAAEARAAGAATSDWLGRIGDTCTIGD